MPLGEPRRHEDLPRVGNGGKGYWDFLSSTTSSHLAVSPDGDDLGATFGIPQLSAVPALQLMARDAPSDAGLYSAAQRQAVMNQAMPAHPDLIGVSRE